MNSALKDMLDAYQPKTPIDYQNAAREVVQELALLGLWRGGFFANAAFYGGTALRIFSVPQCVPGQGVIPRS